MKIKISDAVIKAIEVSEIIDLSAHQNSSIYSLKGIKPFELHVRFETFESEVHVELHAQVPVILECAYTLELFDDVYTLDDELCFNFVNPNIEAESDECFYEKGPYIELDEYVFALVAMLVPIKVVKPGATLPKSGEGYQVINEKDFEVQKNNNRRALDDILDQVDVED